MKLIILINTGINNARTICESIQDDLYYWDTCNSCPTEICLNAIIKKFPNDLNTDSNIMVYDLDTFMTMMNDQDIDMEQWFMSYVTIEQTTIGEYH